MPILMLLAAGGGAVGAVTEFFSDIGNAISSFFGGTNGTETPVTVDNVTAEELLAMVSNPDIITDSQLKDWMVDRNTMEIILKSTIEANKIAGSRNYILEAELGYLVRPKATPMPSPEAGSADTTEDPESPRDIIYRSQSTKVEQIMTVHSAEFEQRYQISWQMVYLFTIYCYSDDAKNGIVSVSQPKVDKIIDALKPKITYYSNPALTWADGSYLSTNTVRQLYPFYNRYNVGVRGNPLTQQERRRYDYVSGSTVRTWIAPYVAVKEVQMLYYKDTYNNTEAGHTGNDTYVRTYDLQSFLQFYDAYGGGRNLSVFLVALDGLPQGKTVSEPIKRMLIDADIDY